MQHEKWNMKKGLTTDHPAPLSLGDKASNNISRVKI